MNSRKLTWDDQPHTIEQCLDAWDAFVLNKTLNHEFFCHMFGFMSAVVVDSFSKLTVLLVLTGLAESNSEAARKIKEGGIKINEVRVTDPNFVVAAEHLIDDRWLLLGKGKCDRAVVQVETRE